DPTAEELAKMTETTSHSTLFPEPGMPSSRFPLGQVDGTAPNAPADLRADFVVNGSPVTIGVSSGEVVEDVILRAVKAAGHISYLPSSRWLVQNSEGESFNRQARMGNIARTILEGTRLWLTLDVAKPGDADYYKPADAPPPEPAAGTSIPS